MAILLIASVKFARDLAQLFGVENIVFLSQDKARIPIGLPISKKQSLMLMHLEYKIGLSDQLGNTISSFRPCVA